MEFMAVKQSGIKKNDKLVLTKASYAANASKASTRDFSRATWLVLPSVFVIS